MTASIFTKPSSTYMALELSASVSVMQLDQDATTAAANAEDKSEVTFVSKFSENDLHHLPEVTFSKSATYDKSVEDAPFIDEWIDMESDDRQEYSSNSVMVKTSPVGHDQCSNGFEDEGRTTNRLNVDPMTPNRRDERKRITHSNNDEIWRHSTLCEYFRDHDVESRKEMRKNKEPKIRWKTKFQNQVFNFLERPTGVKCFIYHIIVFMMVLVCLIFSVLTTVDDRNEGHVNILLIMESCVVAFFGVEYCVRLWAAGAIGKYKGFWGRLHFARKPICVIDLFVVLASAIVLLSSRNGNVFATSAIRGIRFLQILRMLHMDRQAGTWRLLGSVVYIHRQELITTLYIGFLALILSSYFVYLAEKPDPNEEVGNHTFRMDSINRFENYADALWWGVVTVTTIGYGDYVPRTWLGKVIASCFSIFAISFFALPAGILGSGFALKVQQKQRQKKFNKQIPAAAHLIQAVWRCYSTRPGSRCKATWNLYALPNRLRHESKSSSNVNSSTQRSSSTRLSRRELHKTKGNVDKHKLAARASSSCSWDDIIDEVICNNDQECSNQANLPHSYRNVVRAVRVLIFFIRKKEFHQCRKPYDVRDVFEQYSHGYVNITVRLKELQRRLDQTLGKPSTFMDACDSSSQDRQNVTAGYRLRRLEQKVELIDYKLDEILRRLPALQNPSEEKGKT